MTASRPASNLDQEARLPRWPLWAPFAAIAFGMLTWVLFAGIGAFVLSIFQVKLGEDLTSELGTDLLILSIVLGLVGIGGWRAKNGPVWPRLGLKRSALKQSVILVAVTVVLVFVIDYLILEVFAGGGEHREGMPTEADWSFDGVYEALGAIFLYPICEEIFFRGVLFPAISRWTGILLGAIISGLIFGLGHLDGDVWAVVAISISGFVWALLYWRTGSIIPGIICHVVNNALVYSDGFGLGLVVPLVIAASVAITLLLLLPFTRQRATPGPWGKIFFSRGIIEKKAGSVEVAAQPEIEPLLDSRELSKTGVS